MIAPLPRSGSRPTDEELRDLMRENGLTQRDVAELACVSLKTVEGWLAGKKAVSRRTLHPRYLRVIRAMLPGFIAANRGGKA